MRMGCFPVPDGAAFSNRVYHQVFTNIHLSFPATSAGAPMLVDLDFFQISASPGDRWSTRWRVRFGKAK